MSSTVVSPPSFQPVRSGLMALLRGAVEPAVAVVTLVACILAITGAPRPADVVLAVLVFLLLYPSRLPFRRQPRHLFARVAGGWLLVLGLLLVLDFATGLGSRFDPNVLIAWAVITPFVQVVVHLLSPMLLGRLIRLRDPHRALVVGSDALGRAFAASLAGDPMIHTVVVAYFDDRNPERLPVDGAIRVAGRLSDVGAFCREHRIDHIYVALPMSAQPRIVEMLADLRNTTASVWFITDVFRFDPVQPRFDTRCGFPVVAVYDSPFVGVSGVLKRALDLLIASVALVLLAPLMLAVALAIRLESKGPALFRQRRYGLDGEEIVVWKFRSMTVTEDGDTTYRQVQRGDARVTRVGAFIRKTSLDELPQFFNVLQGRMSVVGPRPHVCSVNERYRQQIPGYMLRHKVRPGITGWAQIHGLRGGDDLDSMSRRIEFDLEYLRHWSIGMDLRIIARTVGVVFSDTRAY
jgi:putative colanic acid biosynthesis UDP-glucose lipid carrier transferase